MNVRIVVDSTADLLPEQKAQVSVVPLTVHFGEQEYVDGITIDHKTFYEKLVESDVIPTTSQPTPEAYAQVFREAQAAGEQVVVLTVSSKLSGTCQSAHIAAADFPGMVWVVDTQTVAIGEAILAELALQLKAEGLSAPEIAARLEQEREQAQHQLRRAKAVEAEAYNRLLWMSDPEYFEQMARDRANQAKAGEHIIRRPTAEERQKMEQEAQRKRQPRKRPRRD
jgi:hypothetical protein